uniref:Uncharacterized protein n=1 Tax=Cyprinus carpio TaxID=7962 RepID=A0A8C1PS61_CYPCA
MLIQEHVLLCKITRCRKTGRVTERHRSGCPLATSHADDRFIVNSAHLREVKGTQVVPDHTTRHRHHRQGALAAALQEEWNAMPQQTISRLVYSLRNFHL